MKHTIIGALVAFVLATVWFGGPAFAGESEKVLKVRYEDELAKEAQETDAICGTKIQTSINWSEFDLKDTWQKHSVSSYCAGPLEALASFCKGDNAKKYIRKNITKLECSSARSKDEWSLKVRRGTVSWKIPPDASNAEQFARKMLLKQL